MSNLTNNTAELNKILAAVNALPEAGGGSSGGTSGIYMAKITPAEDTNYIRVEHNLNSDVIAAFLYVDNWTIDPASAGRNFPVAHMYVKTGIDVYTSASAYKNAYIAKGEYNLNNKYVGSAGGWTSNSYTPHPDDANTFVFETANTANAKFLAGQTLTCVIVSDIMGV